MTLVGLRTGYNSHGSRRYDPSLNFRFEGSQSEIFPPPVGVVPCRRPLALRPTWRQLDWDMLRGGRHNWASISGSVALERFQNEKKLLSKHGRNLAVTVSPLSKMDHWEFNHLYEIAALDFADQD